jgi:hypothetical protein
MSGDDNSDSLDDDDDDALIRREPQSLVRAPFSNARGSTCGGSSEE